MRPMFALIVVLCHCLPSHTGEPIPPGALQRLGTTRFRAEDPLIKFAYSRDGKILFGFSDRDAYAWNSDTGELVRRWRFSDKPVVQADIALNPAQHLLAVYARVQGQRELQYWDTSTGQRTFQVKVDESWKSLEWTPDGKRLVEFGFEAKSGNCLSIRGTRGEPNAGRFDSNVHDRTARLALLDGERALLFGMLTKVKIVQLSSGDALRSFDVESVLTDPWHFAISRDGERIALPFADGWRVIDTRTGKLLRTLKPDGFDANSILTSPIFSADGRELFLQDFLSSREPPISYSIDGGNARLRLKSDFRSTSWQSQVVAIRPDGQEMCVVDYDFSMKGCLPCSPCVRIFDSRTGAEKDDSEPGHQNTLHPVWMPYNRMVVGRARGELAWSVWDANTGELIHQFGGETAIPNRVGELPPVLTRDGNTLLDFNSTFLSAWNVATGEPEKRPFGSLITYQPLLYRSRDDRILQHDLGKENLRRNEELNLRWKDSQGRSIGQSFTFRKHPAESLLPNDHYLIRFTSHDTAWPFQENQPDNRSLFLHRSRDGQLIRTFDLEDRFCESVRVSSTGDFVTAAMQKRTNPSDEDSSLDRQFDFREIGSADRICRLPASGETQAMDLSPHGDYLIHGTDDRHVALRDCWITGNDFKFLDVPARAKSFHFSPDGKRLLAVLADTTMVVWDSLKWSDEAAKAAGAAPDDLAKEWEALAGSAPEAWKAARRLSLAGDRAVPFLRERFAAVRPVDEAEIAKRIAELDSRKFAARDGARKALEGAGWEAEQALRQALKAGPAAEVKAALEKLLGRIDTQLYDAETLRQLRAIRALIWINTPEAKKLLHRLATGVDQSPATRMAKDIVDSWPVE